MLNSQTPLLFTHMLYNTDYDKKYADGLYEKSGPNAKNFLNIAKFFGKNTYLSRSGIWSTPWNTQVHPQFLMPQYDKKFSLSFGEITDRRAVEIKKLIIQHGKRVTLYYSGGIDSTLCLVSLLRILTTEELSLIDIAMSTESIIENPYFFEKHILNKFKIIDSAQAKLSDLCNSSRYIITTEQGDSIFGSELGMQFLHSYNQLLQKVSPASRMKLQNLITKISDAEVHFSEFSDLIIAFFQLDRDPNFGQHFYEKMLQNIKSSDVPITSLHDFFWWEIFNIKYIECALRTSVFYYDGSERQKMVNETVFNWFNNENYQKWSMVNNNNGQKINGITPTSYKWAARKYIYEFDKNNWYFKYKPKLASLRSMLYRNDSVVNAKAIFAMDTDYKVYYYYDPEVMQFMESSLLNFN